MLVFSKPVAQSKHGRIDWQVLRADAFEKYSETKNASHLHKKKGNTKQT